jgi:hypothetical protein
MNTVGQREVLAQRRVVAFFKKVLDYAYLGYWKDREGNSNVEQALLTDWLKRQGHSDKIIGKALFELGQGHGARRKQDALRRQPRGLRPASLRGEGQARRRRAEHYRLAD